MTSNKSKTLRGISLLEKRFATLSPGFTASHALILVEIALWYELNETWPTIGDVAAATGLEKPTVYGAISILSKDERHKSSKARAISYGLIEKFHLPLDIRSKRVRLTVRGNNLIDGLLIDLERTTNEENMQ